MSWLGIKIKEILKEKKITTITLAAELGVTRQTINDWINGQIPKGNHLLVMAKFLQTSPNAFFQPDLNNDIVIPVFRQRKNSKITAEGQKDTLALISEYKLFFKNDPIATVLPVIRISNKTISDIKIIAKEIRKTLNSSAGAPIDYKQAFQLLKELGIYVVFQNFPDSIKSYAFYTKINEKRVVFVNNSTNLIDLIFPLLHEAIHAMRDDVSLNDGYDKEEEDLCDEIASNIQFTDEYVNYVYEAICDCTSAVQINKIILFAQKYNHSLFGIRKRIIENHPGFSLDVGGADTNLKKKFPSIGAILNSHDNPYKYVSALNSLTPLFVSSLKKHLDDISDRKLAFLLGIEFNLDIPEIRKELMNYELTN